MPQRVSPGPEAWSTTHPQRRTFQKPILHRDIVVTSTLPKASCQAQDNPTSLWTGWAMVVSGFAIVFKRGLEAENSY